MSPKSSQYLNIIILFLVLVVVSLNMLQAGAGTYLIADDDGWNTSISPRQRGDNLGNW